jgi:hypothetical protein
VAWVGQAGGDGRMAQARADGGDSGGSADVVGKKRVRVSCCVPACVQCGGVRAEGKKITGFFLQIARSDTFSGSEGVQNYQKRAT